MQTDPIGIKDDLNLYAYARNDSINLIDPLGEGSWLAARPVDLPMANMLGKHEYIAVGGDHPGDSKATIISYGELKNGNMGNVSEAADASKFSATTNETDRIDWLSRAPDATENLSKIDAPDDVVRASADAVAETNPYSALPSNSGLAADSGQTRDVNSNSAATAVKIKAESIASGGATKPSVPPISGAPGAKQHERVEFECTGSMEKMRGC